MVTVWVAAVAGSYDGPVVLSAGGALTVHDALLLVPVPPDPATDGGSTVAAQADCASSPSRANAVRSSGTSRSRVRVRGDGASRTSLPDTRVSPRPGGAPGGRWQTTERPPQPTSRHPSTDHSAGRRPDLSPGAQRSTGVRDSLCTPWVEPRGLEPQPPPCKGGALPVELWPPEGAGGQQGRRSARSWAPRPTGRLVPPRRSASAQQEAGRPDRQGPAGGRVAHGALLRGGDARGGPGRT